MKYFAFIVLLCGLGFLACTSGFAQQARRNILVQDQNMGDAQRSRQVYKHRLWGDTYRGRAGDGFSEQGVQAFGMFNQTLQVGIRDFDIRRFVLPVNAAVDDNSGREIASASSTDNMLKEISQSSARSKSTLDSMNVKLADLDKESKLTLEFLCIPEPQKLNGSNGGAQGGNGDQERIQPGEKAKEKRKGQGPPDGSNGDGQGDGQGNAGDQNRINPNNPAPPRRQGGLPQTATTTTIAPTHTVERGTAFFRESPSQARGNDGSFQDENSPVHLISQSDGFSRIQSLQEGEVYVASANLTVIESSVTQSASPSEPAPKAPVTAKDGSLKPTLTELRVAINSLTEQIRLLREERKMERSETVGNQEGEDKSETKSPADPAVNPADDDPFR